MNATVRNRELVRRLTWLMLIRLVLISVVLAIGALVFQEAGPYYVIAAFFAATIAYTLLLKSGLDLGIQGYIQLIVEIALITFIVHSTGGVESIFVGFYIITILCASVLLPMGGGIVIALLASVSFGAVVAAEGLGLLQTTFHGVINPYDDPPYVFFLLFYRIAILFLAGFLSADISRRLREADMEITKLKDLNELILRHISSGLLTTNNTGQIIHANRAAERILESTRENLLGKSWGSLFGLDGLGPDELHGLVSRAQSSIGAEIDVVARSGAAKPVGLSLSDIEDADGSVLGQVIVFRDLTEIKELESRARRSERLSAVGELAAGIAHEIRNPLASIRGSIEVLKERGMFNSKDEELVKVILKESDRLNQIIQGFLDYVRTPPPTSRAVEINDLVDEIVMLYKNSDKVGDLIRIEKRRGAERLIVFGDGDQLKQVLLNLMDNAIEAMPDGGDMLVLCQGKGETVEVEISDTGGGISAGETRLFEPFYTTKSRGIGIGLTIAERIVKNHDGRIDVRRRTGGGAVFTVVLPRHRTTPE